MISIFARPSFIGNRFPRHTKDSSLLRISSAVRAEELASLIGARLNPTSGYEGDVIIHVKPRKLKLVRDGEYVDFLDGGKDLNSLKDRPGVKIIAASQSSYEYLKANFPNEIILIPSHHINFERLQHVRTSTNVLQCGYTGSPSPITFRLYKDIGKRLEAAGLAFKTCFDYKHRRDSVNFYQSIDVMVIGDFVGDDSVHKIPTKIINAASFGVPTVAYPLQGYKEIEGFYVRATTKEELVAEVLRFRDTRYYNAFSQKVREMADRYHINNIAKLYEQLV